VITDSVGVFSAIEIEREIAHRRDHTPYGSMSVSGELGLLSVLVVLEIDLKRIRQENSAFLRVPHNDINSFPLNRIIKRIRWEVRAEALVMPRSFVVSAIPSDEIVIKDIHNVAKVRS